MDALLAIVAAFLVIVALDVTALHFGCDSRRWVREMPGTGDDLSGRPPPHRPVRRRPSNAVRLPLRLTRIDRPEWAVAPPLHGLLRLRPPASTTGYARLDMAALGK